MFLRTLIATALLGSIGTVMAGDNWGAIAYNPTNKDFGAATDYSTPQEARMAAMQACIRQHNSPHCQIIGMFRNDCAALAIGPGGAGYNDYPNARQAEVNALRECRMQGYGACRIETTVCNEPPEADTANFGKSLGDSLMRGVEERRRACGHGDTSQCR